MSDVRLIRAIPGNLESCSLELSDGRRGQAMWKFLLRGTDCISGWLRQDTVRPSEDGQSLLVDRHTYLESSQRQKSPDDVLVIGMDNILAALQRGSKVKEIFQVDGQHGPMTLAFQFTGRVKGSACTDDELKVLTNDEVQYWYTHRGWPKAGILQTTDVRGRPKAFWQMV